MTANRARERRVSALLARLIAFEPGPVIRYALVAASVALTLFLAFVRVATEARFTFSLLLLLPTIWAAWYLGRRWGFAIAALAVGAWLAADLMVASGLGALDELVNAGVRAIVFLLVAGAFAALREAYRELNALAHRDALTGLGNRRLLETVVERERQRALRYRHPLTVACVDLDGFKAVNDRRGHAVGDRVLAEVGAWLRGGLRAVDIPARTGGDEFTVVLPECGGAAARAVAAKLRSAWERRAAAIPYSIYRRSRWSPLSSWRCGVAQPQPKPSLASRTSSSWDWIRYDSRTCAGSGAAGGRRTSTRS